MMPATSTLPSNWLNKAACLIFSSGGALGLQYEVPNYDLPPTQAAQEHWLLHKAAFPPELDPSSLWIETVNEVDKETHRMAG